MGLQVVPVIEIRVTDFALVSRHLAALVAGVPSQRVLVLVPFAARRARPQSGFWKNERKQEEKTNPDQTGQQ